MESTRRTKMEVNLLRPFWAVPVSLGVLFVAAPPIPRTDIPLLVGFVCKLRLANWVYLLNLVLVNWFYYANGIAERNRLAGSDKMMLIDESLFAHSDWIYRVALIEWLKFACWNWYANHTQTERKTCRLSRTLLARRRNNVKLVSSRTLRAFLSFVRVYTSSKWNMNDDEQVVGLSCHEFKWMSSQIGGQRWEIKQQQQQRKQTNGELMVVG